MTSYIDLLAAHDLYKCAPLFLINEASKASRVTASADIPRLVARIEELEETIAVQLALVHRQAEDEGLWFIAQTAPEAYLQQELRRLHSAIEANAASVAVWALRAEVAEANQRTPGTYETCSVSDCYRRPDNFNLNGCEWETLPDDCPLRAAKDAT